MAGMLVVSRVRMVLVRRYGRGVAVLVPIGARMALVMLMARVRPVMLMLRDGTMRAVPVMIGRH
jgi:hypothetical protein